MMIVIIKTSNTYVFCPFAPSATPCYMCVAIRVRGLQTYLASGHHGHRNRACVGPTDYLDLVKKRSNCCSRDLNTGRPFVTHYIWCMFWIALTISITVVIVE